MNRLVPIVACAALTLGAMAAAPAPRPGQPQTAPTRPSPFVQSAAVEAGTFDGTWMYVNRDAQYALWVRTKDGKREVKLQFRSMSTPEAFETDWNGKAEYYMAGSPVAFELKLLAGDARELKGTWSWIVTFPDSGRRESSDLRMVRTGFGRDLRMEFLTYERTIMRGGQNSTVKGPMAWTWVKVAARELLWDELPF